MKYNQIKTTTKSVFDASIKWFLSNFILNMGNTIKCNFIGVPRNGKAFLTKISAKTNKLLTYDEYKHSYKINVVYVPYVSIIGLKVLKCKVDSHIEI